MLTLDQHYQINGTLFLNLSVMFISLLIVHLIICHETINVMKLIIEENIGHYETGKIRVISIDVLQS